LLIFVDRAGDDAERELLGALGLAIEVEGQALLRAVAQPLVERDAVALGLADLLAILVEEQLVIEPLRRARAEACGRSWSFG
jgi:hypothetical protein